MPEPRFLVRLCLLVCLATPLIFTGCGSRGDSAVPAWAKRSLASGPTVRVRLLRKSYFSRVYLEWEQDGITLSDDQGHPIPLPDGTRRVYLKMRKQKIALAFRRGKAAFRKAKRYSEVWLKVPDREVGVISVKIPERRVYRDYEAQSLRLSIKYGRMALINYLPLEMYIARVIPEEMDAEHFTLEALKAQAVVARTWSLKNMGRHKRFGYDFCDSPHCQVYKGRKQVSRRAEKAAKMTLGEVLTYQGRLAEAFYHSTCGGNTVFVEEVWGGRRIAHLARVEDRFKLGNRAYCAPSPYARWQLLTSLRRVERALKKKSVLPKKAVLKSVKVDFINRSGRVKRIRLVTNQGERLVESGDFRKILNREFGKRRLLSHFYEIQVDGQQFRVLGRGLGHGVGLCQWGARGMAQHGFSYVEILQHYFKGTQLGMDDGDHSTTRDSASTTQNSQAGKK